MTLCCIDDYCYRLLKYMTRYKLFQQQIQVFATIKSKVVRAKETSRVFW